MKLAWKLFLSYLVVVLVGGVVLAETTSFTANQAFTDHMDSMHNMMRHHLNGNETVVTQLETELKIGFREAIDSSLLLSSLVALSVAMGLSFYVSQRITQPIRHLVQASHRIAQGDYGEQITFHSKDEIGELIQSFNQMAHALAQTESLRQQLIADVSHELKTPLAGLRGYLEGLEDGVLPATSQTFQTLLSEVQRLQRLVYDLQELSQAEAGQLHLDHQVLNLKQLLQSTVEWLQPQFDDKGVQLTLQLPPQMIEIQGDMDRLQQVLLNVLGNALQYTPNKGIVTVRLEVTPTSAELTIQDSGIGLSPEDQTRIFQRFYRVDKSRSRQSGGSGIGLTVAQYIVEGLGGKIWAESAGLNQGSVFHILLPT